MAYQSNPFDLIEPSYNGMRLTWLRYLQLALIFLGVTAAAVGVGFIVGLAVPALGVLLGVMALLGAGVYLSPAFYRLTLASARGQRIGLREAIGQGWTVPGRLVWSLFLAGLLTLGGFVLLIVPGFFCLAWFALVPYVVLEEGLSGWAALKRSKALAGRRLRDMWGTVGLRSAAGILNFVPLVGPLVVFVLSLLLLPVLAIRYDQLVALEAAGSLGTEPVSRWNYLVIALVFVSVALGIAQGLSQPPTHDTPRQTSAQSV